MFSTLPNLLTLIRIAFIPLIIWGVYFDTLFSRWFALSIFSIAAITDYLDGYFARRWSQTTKFGQIVDPIADKLLVLSILLIVLSTGKTSKSLIIPGQVILCREIFISGLREFLHALKIRIPVSYLSKWKTTVQMFALGFLILGDDPLLDFNFLYIGEPFLWIAMILACITGYKYFTTSLVYIK